MTMAYQPTPGQAKISWRQVASNSMAWAISSRCYVFKNEFGSAQGLETPIQNELFYQVKHSSYGLEAKYTCEVYFENGRAKLRPVVVSS